MRYLLAGALLLGCAHAFSASHAVPARTASIPVEFDHMNSPDRWSNGFWVGYRRSMTPGVIPEIRTFDRDGRAVIPRTPLSLCDVYHTNIHAIAADRNGDVVVSAEVWSSPGEKVAALYRISRDGKLVYAAPTAPFLGRSLAVAPNGDIWSLGSRLMHPLDRRADYEVLERYDASGKLKSRVLPRSGFGVKYDPAVLHDLGAPTVYVSSSGVGVLSPGAKAWVEVGLSGEMLGRFTLEPPAASDGTPATLSSLVMADSGEVYASFAVTRRAGDTGPLLFGIYRLDKSARRWAPVDVLAPPYPRFGGLYGIDGDFLIRRTSCHAGDCTYGWFPLSSVVPEQR